MSFEIRKIVSYVEQTFIEGGKATDKPVTMVGLAVVMKNPWVGNGFVEDLKPQIRANCSDLGAMMSSAWSASSAVPTRSKPTARPPWLAPTVKSSTLRRSSIPCASATTTAKRSRPRAT
ncbi:Amino acid synthesis [compost metagenome]